MCGITGLIQRDLSSDSGLMVLRSMTDALSHRGPDDAGHWFDPEVGVGLGNRRLAILDLSQLGHQPMASASGRYLITYNGEVYNYRTIRKELEVYGSRFAGGSDTEVMIAAFEQWGVMEATTRFVGMFAFAVWDRQERVLHLIRDRLGIKPLYYGILGKAFAFASELKSLTKHPEFRGDIDRDSIALYLRHGYIPAPHTIYRAIYKLAPGSILSMGADSLGTMPSSQSYWTLDNVIDKAEIQPFTGAPDEAAAQLELLMSEAINDRLVADVPVGAFLSGGIDSSTVAAMMQAQSSDPIKTFSIGFLEADHNEAGHAKAVAQHIGSNHTELYISPDQAMATIPKLPDMYDEPFADSSQIPTFLVSQLARRDVTVCLTGDGGDELFGGYTRYRWGQTIWRNIRWMPQVMRGLTAGTLKAISPRSWDQVLHSINPILPKYVKQRVTGDRIHKLADIVAVNSGEHLYRMLVSDWMPRDLLLGGKEPPTIFTETGRRSEVPNLLQHMMYVDHLTYLPDDILTKVDRASMGVSLEVRVPLLDHRIIEFVWSLPLSMRATNGRSKWLLRRVLHKYVPGELVDRPKMGFGVPIGTWLRGPLRNWAESLLDERRIRSEGFFDPLPIRRKWREHLEGSRDWKYHLWSILMFQAWQERWHG